MPASPTNLSIDMGSLSCELNWEFENQIEYPVTGFRIQVMEASEAEGKLLAYQHDRNIYVGNFYLK